MKALALIIGLGTLAGAALAVSLGASETRAEQDLLSPVRARLEALEADLSRAGPPTEKARLMLLTGRHEDALRVMPELPESARVLRGQILIANARFQDVRPLMNDVIQKDMKDPEARPLVYRWWVMVDDLGGMQSAAEQWSEPVDLRARGEVAALTLNFGKAHDFYQQALTRSRTAADSAGGAQRAKAKTAFQRALCAALASPLGAGGAITRHRKSPAA